ncbi:glycosyltransferase family 4 protein [Pseudorhodoplanes sp.]|uniref:glycosyltransferase family 4 protein n=1 Tax=Pseudorhodoplanes sp. TaxID=1934341 RepID=UPI002C9DE383|nr:glycosyltransferase family 4 protein [Pseudorhodoplanes sp.]HWV55269.1 glycosyltransferase family 4 protein [Pseudorhodoplanes sp.]
MAGESIYHLAGGNFPPTLGFMGEVDATVVHNPFDNITAPPDRAVARAALTSELGIDPSHHIIGCVGRLHHEKRPWVLASVIARAARHLGKPAHAVFLGKDEGQQSVVVDAATAEGVADRIHFLGFRYPPAQWIAGMDIVIAPRANEGFGRAVVESMLVGTPVIAANRAGHTEIIDDLETGVLVEPHDIIAFSNAAIWLLSSPEDHKRIADAAMAYARDAYSVEKHVERIQGIYDRLPGFRKAPLLVRMWLRATGWRRRKRLDPVASPEIAVPRRDGEA